MGVKSCEGEDERRIQTKQRRKKKRRRNSGFKQDYFYDTKNVSLFAQMAAAERQR